MAVNFNSVNTIEVDGTREYSIVAPEIDIFLIEQSVYTVTPAQDLILLEQEVLKTGTFEGSILNIEQEVIAQVPSQDLFLIEQTVLEPGESLIGCDLVDWDIIVTINGNIVPNSSMLDDLIVERGENESSLAEFTINGHTNLGVQDICEIQGKPVTISTRKDDVIKRIYTGIVDYPEYDIIREKVRIKCTDKRREQINSQIGNAIKSIGYWTESIFGEVDEPADELDDRLTTVPKVVDFDAYGNYTVSDLLPKSTPDFILGSTDILKRDPDVEVLSRARIINKVVIDFGYRFNRLHHSEVSYVWNHPDKNNFCQWAQYGRTLASREMIRSAAEGAGWQISKINYSDLWPGGLYSCGGSKVGWSPIRTLGTSWKDAEDSEGNKITTQVDVPDLDDNGQLQYDEFDNIIMKKESRNVQQRQSTTVQDMNETMCLGAAWGASNRWVQDLTERYEIVVKAPESIAQFGEVIQEKSYGVSSDFDTQQWETYEEYANNAGIYEPQRINTATGNSYYINLSDNRSDFNESYLVATNQARTTIIDTHRDNRSILQTPLQPDIDLKHTVQVQMSKLEQLGKVTRIRHIFKASNHEAITELELASSKVCLGTATDTPLSIPSAPGFPAATQIPNVGLGNHFGLDPDTYPGADAWTGMVGNQIIGGYTASQEWTLMTQYPISFTVETPDIPDALRNELESTKVVNYDVKIPNNTFNVIFDGSCA